MVIGNTLSGSDAEFENDPFLSRSPQVNWVLATAFGDSLADA